MATIIERTTASGRKVQRVRIRLQGYPEQNATFKTITEAKEWAKITEAAMQLKATLGNLIEQSDIFADNYYVCRE